MQFGHCMRSVISKHPMLLFNCFHHRLLFLLALFQNILCYCLTPPRLLPWDCCRISKHPMLLFNHVHFQANESMNTFQNILCYCLTSTFSALWTLCCISKHPMLLFNTGICVKTTTIQLISKHPMLLFNAHPIRQKHILYDFKTSYVTV